MREGEENYVEAIRYRRRLKICENFLFSIKLVGSANEAISKFILFISIKETQKSKTKPKKVK